jgi:hypothetical protein
VYIFFAMGQKRIIEDIIYACFFTVRGRRCEVPPPEISLHYHQFHHSKERSKGLQQAGVKKSPNFVGCDQT